MTKSVEMVVQSSVRRFCFIPVRFIAQMLKRPYRRCASKYGLYGLRFAEKHTFSLLSFFVTIKNYFSNSGNRGDEKILPTLDIYIPLVSSSFFFRGLDVS